MKELIILSGLGLFALASEVFNFRKILFPVVILGLLASITVSVFDWNTNEVVFNMIIADNFALAFNIILSSIALFWFILSKEYQVNDKSISDYFSLVLFALVGTYSMVSFSNLTMLFIGIEILSLPMYVLAGSSKKDLSSNEASFKYFLMGSFASGFLLFGIALIYGATGSLDLATIAGKISTKSAGIPSFLIVGILLVIFALGFKVSAAPFHFWAPDVYQGSPTIITALMSTVVKIAAFGAFFRLFSNCFTPLINDYSMVLWLLCSLTLLAGNITAVWQQNAKRMLAYSSIAHAGFMLMAVLAMNANSVGAILYYSVAYGSASLTAFTVLIALGKSNGDDYSISAFNGLIKNNPLMGLAMTIALLSMAGIPPLSGFFAKYFIFSSVFDAGYNWLVIIAIIGSLIGVYYYFKIVIAMITGKHTITAFPLPISTKIVLWSLTIITLLAGLFPGLIINLI